MTRPDLVRGFRKTVDVLREAPEKLGIPYLVETCQDMSRTRQNRNRVFHCTGSQTVTRGGQNRD